jgi:RNA polymerase sigma-70 factor (ECF subfamily)
MADKLESSSEDQNQPREFATTHWSLVVAAGDIRPAERRAAMETLCSNYWYPLYSYARRRVAHREQAEDVIQSFLETQLEKNFVATANADRGRFRAFLITALKHHLQKQWDKQRAKKRGGGRLVLSLDFESAESRYSIEPATQMTAEQIFDRNWAVTLLNRVLDELAREQQAAGKQDQFKVLKPFLVGQPDSTYAKAAESLDMTEAATKMAVTRLRKIYRQTLRAEIAQTVVGEAQIEQEIRDLFKAV